MLDFSLMRLFSVIFFQSLANFPAKGLLAREAPSPASVATLARSVQGGPLLGIVIFHFYLQHFLFSSTRILHL